MSTEAKTSTLDLGPATAALADLIEGVRDEQLTAPTPCEKTSVADLIDHVDGLSVAFTNAALKTPPLAGSPGPSADGSRLGPDWRARIPARLAALAQAWRDEGAWSGMTEAGGQQLPGQVAGVIALNEVIVHGWDIATASGQGYRCEPHLLEAAQGFVGPTAAARPEGTPGLFGPPVAVPDDAPLLDRLIGQTGRDPAWRPQLG
jgi:uncharacterized protein (TIGR03086 family)